MSREKYANEETVRALVNKLKEFATKVKFSLVQAFPVFGSEAASQYIKPVVADDGTIVTGRYKSGTVDPTEDGGGLWCLLYSTDNGQTWNKAALNTSKDRYIARCLGIGKASDRTLVAAVTAFSDTTAIDTSGLLMYSTDNGKTWQDASCSGVGLGVTTSSLNYNSGPISGSISCGIVSFFTASNGNMLVYGDNIPTAISTNNGRTWSTLASSSAGYNIAKIVEGKNGRIFALKSNIANAMLYNTSDSDVTVQYGVNSINFNNNMPNCARAGLNTIASNTVMQYSYNATTNMGLMRPGIWPYASLKGTQSNLTVDSNLIYSDNGGSSWTALGKLRGQVCDIVAFPDGTLAAKRWYCAQASAAFTLGSSSTKSFTTVFFTVALVWSKSADNGDTWTDASYCETINASKNVTAASNGSISTLVLMGPGAYCFSQAIPGTNTAVAYDTSLIYKCSFTSYAGTIMAKKYGTGALTKCSVNGDTTLTADINYTKTLELPDGSFASGKYYSADGVHWYIATPYSSSSGQPSEPLAWTKATFALDNSLVCVGNATYGVKRIPALEPFI